MNEKVIIVEQAINFCQQKNFDKLIELHCSNPKAESDLRIKNYWMNLCNDIEKAENFSIYKYNPYTKDMIRLVDINPKFYEETYIVEVVNEEVPELNVIVFHKGKILYLLP